MNNRQNGQVGLVVLLIASVLLTLGIGVASQSVLQTKTATQETDSSSIFNVTERAIEEALRSLTGSNDPNGDVVVNVNPVSTSYQVDVSEGDVAQLILQAGTKVGTITSIGWKDPGEDVCGAAIVVALIGGSNGETVARYAYDKPGCRSENGFTSDSSIVTCSDGFCSVSPPTVSDLKLARIKVLYSDTTLQAALNGAPAQAMEVVGQGTDKVTGETRAISAIRSAPSVPAIFDYALFSGTDISKN